MWEIRNEAKEIIIKKKIILESIGEVEPHPSGSADEWFIYCHGVPPAFLPSLLSFPFFFLPSFPPRVCVRYS